VVTWSSAACRTGGPRGRVPLLVFGSKRPRDSVYAVHANTWRAGWRFIRRAPRQIRRAAPPDISERQNGLRQRVVYVTGKTSLLLPVTLAKGTLIWKARPRHRGTNGRRGGGRPGRRTVFTSTHTPVSTALKRQPRGPQVWQALSGATFSFDSSGGQPGGGRQVLWPRHPGQYLRHETGDWRGDPVDAEDRQQRLWGSHGRLEGLASYIRGHGMECSETSHPVS